MNETSFMHSIRGAFKRRYPSGYWRKLHGNKFQRNLPDALLLAPGWASMVEFKFYRGTGRDALATTALGQLTSMQCHELTELARARSPLGVRIVVGMPMELCEGEESVSGILAVSLDLLSLADEVVRALLDKWTYQDVGRRVFAEGLGEVILPGVGNYAQWAPRGTYARFDWNVDALLRSETA